MVRRFFARKGRQIPGLLNRAAFDHEPQAPSHVVTLTQPDKSAVNFTTRPMRQLLRKIKWRVFDGLARSSELHSLYDQISGLIQIQRAMQGQPVHRPLRGWAVSPDAMAWILADLQERQAPVAIEFGSGQSTVIFAAALRHREGRLISVEHNLEHSAAIQRQVQSCGLSKYVQFVHAPLTEMKDAPSGRTYDLTGVPETLVDVAFVDGPPHMNGVYTRLTPLRWAACHLKPGAVIFLDDSLRPFEQACIEQLIREHPNLRTTRRAAEKGLTELRKVGCGS
jgi:predicted O-methyltransferase YrrM